MNIHKKKKAELIEIIEDQKLELLDQSDKITKMEKTQAEMQKILYSRNRTIGDLRAKLNNRSILDLLFNRNA